ncbi:hypothetical protein SH661x_003998 [Planctomicrobium sp. SH661]|uniref:hypothetical protein n=1 Tax=Planctomicrobium sp. SH661 TaxID=3448124 RepID=UPI003F5AFAC4
MAFHRRILHHGPDPDGLPQLISITALRSCWFELHRQGGCGRAQLVLSDDFEQRGEIELGDWISLEVEEGDRWYLGRVEERSAESPAVVRYRLEGMAVELNQIFPGGFGMAADGRKPHRYAATDQFPFDPDHAQETFDFAGSAVDVVRLLMTQYIVPATHVQYVPAKVENPAQSSPLYSMKVRGEESVRSVLKDLALRAQSAAWGVDADGKFFFLRARTTLLATYREQRDLTTLAESRDLEFLYNRLLLTGDYVYDQQETSNDVARKVYRWRGNFFEPTSRAAYGDRRLKIWLPWIRTQDDSRAFAREFFRTYSRPASRYFIETTGQTTLPVPWLGEVRLQDREGTQIVRSRIETIRVLFDHIPRFRMELGPEDPRTLWPEPPQDERWEIPNHVISAGGDISLPPPLPSGGGGGGSEGESSDSSWSSSSPLDSSSDHSSHDASTSPDSSTEGGGHTTTGEPPTDSDFNSFTDSSSADISSGMTSSDEDQTTSDPDETTTADDPDPTSGGPDPTSGDPDFSSGEFGSEGEETSSEEDDDTTYIDM